MHYGNNILFLRNRLHTTLTTRQLAMTDGIVD